MRAPPTPLRARDLLEVPHRLVMGLNAVRAPAGWLVLDADRDADLAEKQRLLAQERDQVFVEQPESRPAQRETLELILANLAEHHPEARIREAAPEDPPLLRAARSVQEDLVVMEPRPEGWCLTAAAVCFPTRWDLPSKLGLPLDAIHARVPGYAGPLSDSAARFFDGVAAEPPFQRGNWSLVDDPALHQPSGKLRAQANEAITARNAGQRVWLRCEHQTLRRLPRTGAVLFTIRVLQQPLARATEDPAVARALGESLRTMDPELKRYKSLPVLEAAVQDYLASRA